VEGASTSSQRNSPIFAFKWHVLMKFHGTNIQFHSVLQRDVVEVHGTTDWCRNVGQEGQKSWRAVASGTGRNPTLRYITPNIIHTPPRSLENWRVAKCAAYGTHQNQEELKTRSDEHEKQSKCL